MILDNGFVQFYAMKYDETELSKAETYLFSHVGPAVLRRGKYVRDEFELTCDWKSSRTRNLVKSNSPDQIEEVTELALHCSENLRIPILSILRGVSTPTASALLTVWQPERYTITDYRVLNSLAKLSHPVLKKVKIMKLEKSYTEYLGLMQSLSYVLNCSLRALDKALWTFDKHCDE